MYGEEVAILAGDALLALAFEYVARETRGVAAERIVRVRGPCAPVCASAAGLRGEGLASTGCAAWLPSAVRARGPCAPACAPDAWQAAQQPALGAGSRV